VGTSAVQLAKYYGAEVTAVCSAGNFELVKSLGAHKTIDYRHEDFLNGEQKYDAVFDTVGNISIKAGKLILNSGGKLVRIVGSLAEMLEGMKPDPDGKKVFQGPAPERKEDLEFLAQLVTAGKLKVVIGKTYELKDMVEAHRYLDTGHKRGNIAIEVAK
jgi:NADPH:quinone reductase-like Zn-dependent oxidoreductase